MQKKTKRGVVVLTLLLLCPAFGWAGDIRNGATGSDGAYYQAEAQPNSTIKIQRNGANYSTPGTNVLAASIPAMTRVGNRLYVVARHTNNNIYCTRSDPPYTSWTPWVYLSPGQTLDAPAIASTGSQVWAFVRGTDNRLWRANVTNCPSSTTWMTTNQPIQAAPTSTADESGIYVAYLGGDNEFHRYKNGTSDFRVARGFGSDQDVTGAAFVAYNS